MPILSPFISRVMPIEKNWIDYNGHLNMAYYNVLFDRCSDDAMQTLGMGPDYLERRGFTIYTAEAHVCYIQELHVDQEVTVSFQLIDHDQKRLRAYQEVRHVDGWLAASSETLSLHVDTAGPKVAPFPTDIFTRVRSMRAEHAALPTPERVGRSIGLRQGKSAI